MSISVLNTDAGLSGKTIVNLEDSQTITGAKLFDRDPNAPFSVSAGSAVVANLDADKVDGYEASALAVLAENETVSGNWIFSGTLTASGNVTIGDASTDTLTVNSAVTHKAGTGTGTIIPAGIIARDVAVATVASTAAETTVFTTTIPANTLGTNRILRITLFGSINNTSGGAVTYNFRLKFGGTTVIASGALSHPSDANKRYVTWRSEIAAANATNAQRVVGHLFTSDPAANADGNVALVFNRVGRYDALTIDSTSDQTLALTVEMNTSSANAQFLAEIVYVELLN